MNNDILYAPWRDQYVAGAKNIECVFCKISKNIDSDIENRVLYRDEICFVVMNLYPYTPGHFMIIPHRHLQNLEDLPENEWLHITKLAQRGVKLLKEKFRANGANIGMNLGESGGAGIAEHLHLHVLPRFNRDTNFMTTVANVRVYSTDFEAIYNNFINFAEQYFKD